MASVRRRPLAVVAMSLLAAAPVPSQVRDPTPLPLPAGADARSWEPHYRAGLRLFRDLPDEGDRGFYWASRLDPTRAEPLFARYAAAMALLTPTQLLRFWRGDADIRTRPVAVTADSLHALAFARNPFVPRSLEIVVLDRLPGLLPDDRDTRALVAAANGDHRQAIRLHSRTIAQGGEAAPSSRLERARSYVHVGQADLALADLRALLADARRAERRGTTGVYASQHLLLFMIGRLHLAGRDLDSAHAAFAEALVEDASFAYAHAGIATVARQRHEHRAAADALTLGVALAPTDAVLRQMLAESLAALGRDDEAAAHLAEAVRLEPHWPSPVLLRARLHDRAGRADSALVLYRRFAAMAPESDPIAQGVRSRLAARRDTTPRDAPR